MDAETVKKNEEIMKKKKAALEAEKKAKEKEAADKAPAGKGKKDAKKGKKKWCLSQYLPQHLSASCYFQLKQSWRGVWEKGFSGEVYPILTACHFSRNIAPEES